MTKPRAEHEIRERVELDKELCVALGSLRKSRTMTACFGRALPRRHLRALEGLQLSAEALILSLRQELSFEPQRVSDPSEFFNHFVGELKPQGKNKP